MKIVKKKLSELHPLEKNVRRHSPKQISEYVRSLNMFEQLRPLVIDEDGTIWIGNGMFEAMKSMGWEYAECEIRRGLTEKQKKKMMMADNRIYELGMTDTDVFDEIIRSLDGDVDVPGWDADLLETLNASVQQVNDMVDNYGSYQPEEIARYNERRAAPACFPGEYLPGGTDGRRRPADGHSAIHHLPEVWGAHRDRGRLICP